MKLEDARIVIGTPVAGGELWSTHVVTGYSESVRLMQRCMPHTQTISATATYHADNIRARNRLAAMVLREFPDSTHILFWDSDDWPEDPERIGHVARDGGVGLVKLLVESGEDVIACAYTRKKFPIDWIHQQLDDRELQGDMLEVRAVGMGFTLISTACLRKMTSHYADGDYYDLPEPHSVANLFGMLYDEMPAQLVVNGVSVIAHRRVLMSEDFSFCKRWRDMGGRIMVLSRGVIVHSGAHGFSTRDRE